MGVAAGARPYGQKAARGAISEAMTERDRDLIVTGDGAGGWRAEIAGRRFRCAVGRGGLTGEKREGDGATPIGAWPLRRLHYRPDRLDPPKTDVPLRPIRADDGWCDDPTDAAYNRLIKLPYPAGHEVLWREDALYDLVGELGYNDAPPRPGAGSAIFLHVARPDYGPTEGCVALAKPELLEVVVLLRPDSRVVVKG